MILKCLLNIFKLKRYSTRKQRETFDSELKSQIEKKIQELEEEGSKKDKEINNLFTEIWIKENNINLF